MSQMEHLSIGDFDDVSSLLQHANGLKTLQICHKWDKLHTIGQFTKLERIRLDFDARVRKQIPVSVSLFCSTIYIH